ncbi:MAG TPA: AMP-binding protein [Thermoanaerobaculia bacterium]|nr:AMP-binding protein [Thermoanaerobaculia bacterium]
MKTAEPTPASGTAEEILGLIRTLALELHPGRRGLGRTSLDSSLERDFGLDSLGRAELLTRLEKAFGVRLPEALLASAETPRDFVNALASADVVTAERLPVEESFGDAAERVPDGTRTLLEVLDWHVQRHPERRHILFYPGDGDPEELTFGGLDRRARTVAAGLRDLGVGPGQAVGIMLPSCLDYFAAFYGAQMAGAIPVPLYPPARKSQIEDHLRRQAGILATSQAGVLITFSDVLPLARLLRAQLPELRKVVTVPELSGTSPVLPGVKDSDIAFLQFTSGSTGNPKGVTLTHANLLANLRSIGKAVEMGPDDVVVSWLPLYHDMGLIGSWMGSLYFGLPLVLMSPLTFLARPSRWLWALHRHRGTLSPAPNFAYELCVRKVEEAEIDGLDLSSWRYALNGAEPVSPEAMRRFTERYAPYGFDPKAMAPVYGLAENSLALAFTPLGRGPVLDTVDRETFQGTGQAAPVPAGHPGALRFVSCGIPVPDHEIRIVDEGGNEVGERQEGRLEFRGPSATSGYYRNPEATAKLIRDPKTGWIDSGDRAYIAGGEVYVTGRVKDIIIRAGRNLYPHELEEAVGEIPGIRKGCVAVFGAADPASGTERVVVLAETREHGEETLERLRNAVQEVAVDLLGTPADDVVLAPPHAVPKTSSGKVRRAASRDLYELSRIGRGGAAVWLQLVHLGWQGLKARAAQRARRLSNLLYGAWFWTVFALAVLPVAAALLITPGRKRRRRLARNVARGMAALTSTPIRVKGLEKLPDSTVLLASNHASYLDAFVLTAALPPDAGFVAKRELEGNAFARALLTRLGAVFVERFEAGQGEAETGKVAEAAARGDSLVIFPEGTFSRIPGLRPFRMGTFVVAARTGVPVVPVAIRGTRSKLRGDGWFPWRGGVDVELAPPVRPDGTDWAAAVRLRDAVRAAILTRCGEPDLA